VGEARVGEAPVGEAPVGEALFPAQYPSSSSTTFPAIWR